MELSLNIIENRRLSRFRLYTIYILVCGGYVKLFFPVIGILIDILQVSMSVLCLLMNRSIRIYKGRPLSAFIRMIAALLLMCASYIYSTDKVLGKSRLIICIMTIVYMAIVYMIAVQLTRTEMERLIKVFIYFNQVIITTYFLLYLGSFISAVNIGGRLGDAVGNSIWLGRLCAEQIALIVIHNNWKLTGLEKLNLLFLLLTCIMTGSKGPLISVIMLLAFTYVINTRLTGKKIVIVCLAVIGVAVIIYYITNSTNYFIISRFSLDSALVKDPGYRVSRYTYTLGAIPEQLITGHGMGSWAKYYWGSFGIIPTANDYPHNIVLEMLFESGFVMTLLWIGAIFKIYNFFRSYRQDALYVFMLVLLANVLFGMFSGSIIDGNRGIYYYFAICVAIGSKKQDYALVNLIERMSVCH